MRWADAISILSLALGSVLFLCAGIGTADSKGKKPPSSVILVDEDGGQAPLDSLIAAGEIGLIAAAAPDTAAPPMPAEPPQPKPSAQKKTQKTPSSKSQKTTSAAATPQSKTVPPPQSGEPPPTPKAASACVNINTADEKQLTALKGIGPATAASIVAHRQSAGPFKRKEDIQKVKGIGPAKYAQIVDDICF